MPGRAGRRGKDAPDDSEGHEQLPDPHKQGHAGIGEEGARQMPDAGDEQEQVLRTHRYRERGPRKTMNKLKLLQSIGAL